MSDATASGRRPRRRHRLVFAGLASILALSAFASVEAASARLYVPSVAAAGQSITVRGTGFHSGQIGNLTYNGGVVEAFKASSSGSFNLAFRIPPKAKPGRGRISAKTKSSALLATTTLTITSSSGSPTPTPTPTPTWSADPSSGSSASPSAGDSAGATPTPTPTPTPGGVPAAAVPAFNHVYVIVFENHEYSQIVGSSAAPFINSLVTTYGVSTSFYAERHPSEPNYLALVSGSTQGVTDDGQYNLGAENLFHQLSTAGHSWHSYQQGFPGNCYTGSSASSRVDGAGLSGAYARKHDPAISFTNVSGDPAQCANITGLAGFDPAAADFELIVPNLINSMHDGTIADGDAFLKAFLPQITGSAAFNNSVVFVTFDEGTSNTGGGGRVVTIAIPSGRTTNWSSSSTYSHYSILRTVEEAWGLPLLGGASSAPAIDFSISGASAALARAQTVQGAGASPAPSQSPSATPTATPPAPIAAPDPLSSWPPGATASRMDLLVPCAGQADCYVYTVRGAGANGSGVDDDLPGIARYFGVPVSAILGLNPGLASSVAPGQQLRIPPPTR